MSSQALEFVLDQLGGNIDIEIDAIRKLEQLETPLSSILLNHYRIAKKWQVRSSCVFYSIAYARDEEDAVKLGIEALLDKSKVVRYRACMLLACSLNKNALEALRQLELSAKDIETIENAKAAIDAIENQNTNWFVDRNHSRKVFLTYQ